MAELRTDLRVERIRANLNRVHDEIAQAATRVGRDPGEVEVLAATKYVSAEDLPTLAEAGIRLVGENRAQDLQAKVAAHGELFEWDFIGQLQSRRVRLIVPIVRLIHSVASESALRELERYREQARPGLRILIEVNVAREEGKAGVEPGELDAFIAGSPVPVAGLMTMPPLSPDRSATPSAKPAVGGTAAAGWGQDNRRWFAALRELASERGLEHLSMGTSQDYSVAVEEGATIVRIGTKLYD
jgi:PLP dependent protein